MAMHDKDFVTNKSLYELCEALGINPPEMERVVRLEITAAMESITTVQVWYYADRRIGAPVETKRYRLIPIED